MAGVDMQKTGKWALAFVLGWFAGFLIVSFISSYFDFQTETATLDFISEAETIVEACAEEEYRPACYDRVIPKLMDDGFSMEEAFLVTKEVQRLDDRYQYCHVLGHYLSQKETAKDPSRWKDVVARAPRGICSNGAIHGAFQERFSADALPDATVEELKTELVGICDRRPGWKPTGLETGSCLHALGHLTMYATGGDINKSLELCDELIVANENKSNLQLCYDGAFMQIFQPLEPEDEALVAHIDVSTTEKAGIFCSDYEEEQFGSCTIESWAIYDEEVSDPRLIHTICDPLVGTGWQFERCSSGIFYVTAAQMNLELDRIIDFCSQVNENLQNSCFANAATRMIEVDWDNIPKAVEVCDRAPTNKLNQACYEELVKMSDYSIDIASEEFVTLCGLLPGSYQKRCFAKM